MMRTSLLLVCIFFFFGGCTDRKSKTKEDVLQEEKVIKRDTVIHLVEALDAQPTAFYISEIADSITYLPLETGANCLLSRTIILRFAQDGIYPGRCLKFGWDGKFVKQIGRVGQGRGEDPNAFAWLLKSKDLYYTVGNRIIEYDTDGEFTGKETNKFFLKSREDSTIIYNLFREVESAVIDGHILIYQYPDSLIWVDTKDFKVDHTARVVEQGDIKVDGISFYLTQCFFISYNEKKIFYNFYNDTIYTVRGDGLSPEWVVDLGNRKLPNEVTLYKLGPLSRQALRGGSIEASELITKTDGKIFINNIYESDRFLLFYYSETRYFWGTRKKDPPVGKLIIYDKVTKNLTNIKDKIIDDLNGPGLRPFYDGVIDNKLIAMIWPFELKEYVNEHRNEGKLSSKLIDIADHLDNEDNPVLIIVHLKK